METKRKNQIAYIGKLNSISAFETEITKIVWEQKNATVSSVHEILFKKEANKEKKIGFRPYTKVYCAKSDIWLYQTETCLRPP